MIIAIDGPAGAGKSTVAQRVARELKFAYINTGAMYRAIALVSREREWELPADQNQIVELGEDLPLRFGAGGTRIWAGEREVTDQIGAPAIGSLASQIAACGPLRERVAARQRELGLEAQSEVGGAVLEGRDIQTVVFPDAELKIFLTASDAARAWRRLNQWQEKGAEGASLEAAARDVAQRDARDAGRAASPLRAAPDAVHVSTDDLNSDEVVARIVGLARQRSGLEQVEALPSPCRPEGTRLPQAGEGTTPR